MQTELIGAAEVCERLNIGRTTLQRWAKSGRLEPVHKAPGTTGPRLYDPADVDALRPAVSQ
ncbi:helix-turn-helix domain-containing protein [Rhodococcoides fascians]|uniref:helix-turn-helix domain-containing protein n=1 Tax=Rhodococcoides fascians TaxID=1828 RepID=UPI001D92AAE8|nr:helix-turn-helix domain-containing protein [Rhodococcus fascians]CAH0318901.1 hypothetical protein SRABI91_05305 [Rhodococcus fascians]